MNILVNVYPNYAWPNQLNYAGLTAMHNRISLDRYFIIACVFVGYACTSSGVICRFR